MDIERSGSGARVVLLHGFTQTRRSWDEVIGHLPPAEYLLVDLPGHGSSTEDRSDMDATARQVAESCGSGIYIGYSMGGRIAMKVAIQHPAAVTGLVVIGADPGIEDARERSMRHELDQGWGARLEEEGVEGFLRGWMQQPILEGVPTRSVEHRLTNTADGLAWAIRNLGAGAMEPMWDRLSEIDAPLLFVAGERDSKYRDRLEQAAGLVPGARLVVVPNAGHAPHIETPVRFAAAVTPFLQELISSSLNKDSRST